MKLQGMVLFLAFVLLSSATGAEVYRWTDEQGRVHFGDQPRGKAERVELQVRTVRTVTIDYLDEWKLKRTPKAASRGLVMYSTSWCGYCKKAKRYFQANGIAYTEKDIEKSEAARLEYERLGGTGGVPFFVKGRHTMQGFRASRFEAFLEKAES